MAAQHTDVGRDVRKAASVGQCCQTGTHVKSYRWLRLAIVGLLLSIAAAVALQIYQQQSLLGSVSAYYYTPAQAIFVGGLIGLGACMIALKGDPSAEDIFLNLGGMFAAVVAVVPTGRNADFRAVVRACRETGTPLLTERAVTTGLDCPTVQGLAEATRANVANNLTALLLVGFLALVVSLVFALRERVPMAGFLPGFTIAAAVWAATLVARVTALDWVIDRAHLVAAIALGVCVLIVMLINALRVDDRAPDSLPSALVAAAREFVDGIRPRNRYVGMARAAVGASAVVIVLWAAGIITIFWLEVVVGVFFAVFWSVQTTELDRSTTPAQP